MFDARTETLEIAGDRIAGALARRLRVEADAQTVIGDIIEQALELLGGADEIRLIALERLYRGHDALLGRRRRRCVASVTLRPGVLSRGSSRNPQPS